MRATLAGAGMRRACLAVLLLTLGVWAVAARADDPAKPDKSDKAAKPGEAAPMDKGNKPAEKPKEKTFAFAMDKKPWTQVLEWFADHTGLAFSGTETPTGTFTFTPPKGKEYTIGEIVDIINESLRAGPPTQQFLLVRRSQTFTLVPADQPIPADILPNVDPADLSKYGRTEPVRVDVQLKGANAEEVAPVLKKTMSKFGDAIALEATNSLILIDTNVSIQHVLETVRKIDQSEGASQQFTHQCEYIKARDAERVLKDLIGDKTDQTQQQPGFDGGRGFGGPGGPGGFPFFNRGGPAMQQPQTPPKRRVAVAADENSNVIMVTGPADKIALAKQFVTDLEKKAKDSGAKRIPKDNTATVERYPVEGGNADAIANVLKQKYDGVNSVRISAVGTSEVMVYAPVADQFEIADIIKKTQRGGQTVEMIPIRTADATKIAAMLKNMVGDRDKSPSAPFIEAQEGGDLIAVHGTKDQINEIKAAVKVLDSGAGNSLRVITLQKGSGSAVAEEIRRMLKEMGRDVQIVNPADVTSPGKPEPLNKPRGPEDKPGKPMGSIRDGLRSRTLFAQAGPEKPPLFDPKDEKKGEKKEEKKPPKITIIPSGNRITVISDDPEVQRLVQQLVNLMTTESGGEDFQVIRLKKANAVDVARMLDEMYNPP
ncbi:MAG TPA: secretin N-terminal domain-containing protein, partial [Gemmataceae bacterium]|nr:secretin N-terminal domain-containing protein [Gemmataceae bacterium]